MELVSQKRYVNIFSNHFFTTKPFGQKNGLGLSIVYNQVQKLGGTIECLPDRDGAAFLIKLVEYGGAHEYDNHPS